ncbi:hypothetical protein BIV23_12715 [Streptomyces monashensis]|uniref:Uncharacterized protein n=1 Tax=Streptomyces monashensis TaxID=1678012 RepID=A0A1S2QIZ5_9ACTN|nr:hypothetical protein BIV23_12715 [Streptomyces monashensis]
MDPVDVPEVVGAAWRAVDGGGVEDSGGVGEAGRSWPRPMLRLSGAVAAWARSPEPRSIEEKARPPPTSATAVATTARRWLFFQRASCRRRAARPCGARGASVTSAAPAVASMPYSAGSAAGTPSYQGASSSAGAGAVEGMCGAAVPVEYPSVPGGAMSGA